MQEKKDTLVISPQLIEEAGLSVKQMQCITEKLSILKNFLVLFQVSQAWQLQLVTGEMDYFIKHRDKVFENFNICHYAILFSNPLVLDMLKEWNQSYLKSTLEEPGFIIILANTSNSFILDWVKSHYKDCLFMNVDGCNLAHFAAASGLVAILEWIKINESWMLNELVEGRGTSIMHSASGSGNRQALDFCYNYNKRWVSLPDSNDLKFTHYALGSFNPSQLNYALSLSETPWSFENIFLEKPWDCKMLATIDVALDENINLHSTSYQNNDVESVFCNIFINEIQKKLNRNIQIHKDFNVIKPIFIMLSLAIKLDQSSYFSFFNMDLCNYIGGMLFDLAVPKQKQHLVNQTFFTQVNKDLNSEPKEVNPFLDGENVYCARYRKQLEGLG